MNDEKRLAVITILGFQIAFACNAFCQSSPSRVNELRNKAYEPVLDPVLTKQVDEVIKKFYKYRDEKYTNLEKLKNREEKFKVFDLVNDFEVKICRELVDLGLRNPKSHAAQIAWSWVIEKPGRGDALLYGVEFRRAASLLVEFHSDNPYVARQALWMHNLGSPGRDIFIYGLFATARSQESIGMAKLAMAQYLQIKISNAKEAKKVKGRESYKVFYNDENDKLIEEERFEMDHQFAYSEMLRTFDIKAAEEKVIEIYNEIIEKYDQIPFATSRDLEFENALKMDPPVIEGRILTKEEIQARKRRLETKAKTLGNVARAKLYEIQKVSIGKLAPDITATGVDGKSFKLSDYRGKVVFLVFWATWCGPCMANVPHERAIANKFKDKPFTIVGVNCDQTRQKANDAIKNEMMTWPNFFDGESGSGPIAEIYRIQKFPSTFLIDKNGVIRNKDLYGDEIEKEIEKLLVNLETSNPSKKSESK
jgi:peroxiredoxin